MIWSVLLAFACIIISGLSGFVSYYYSSELEDDKKYVKSLVVWVTMLLSFATALISVLFIIAATKSVVDNSRSAPLYYEARCKSIPGTTYSQGHCFKNGIELKWSDDGEQL